MKRWRSYRFDFYVRPRRGLHRDDLKSGKGKLSLSDHGHFIRDFSPYNYTYRPNRFYVNNNDNNNNINNNTT